MRKEQCRNSPDDQRRQRGECVGARRWGLDGAAGEGHVTGAVNRQQAMNSLEMEEWRKCRRTKKCKIARPSDKLVVGAKILYKRNIREDGEVEMYKYRHIT